MIWWQVLQVDIKNLVVCSLSPSRALTVLTGQSSLGPKIIGLGRL